MKAEELAVLFHDTYERLAPSFGYTTRPDTREFNPASSNGKLMIAVCGEVLNQLQFPSGVCFHGVPLEQECTACEAGS